MPTCEDLRAEQDRALAESLLREHEIKTAIEHIEKDADRHSTRRQLLATAVRLGPEVAPELNEVVKKCVEALEVEIEIELYAYPSPHFNAACVRPEGGRVFLLFSSELLESFENAELMFVVGHELGHHMLRHHDIPVGGLLRGEDRVPARLAMQLFAWSRYAEISADRAGLYCARDLDAVARALFKMASGLRSGASNVAMSSLLRQIEDMESTPTGKGDDEPRSDWFATHPFSPLRLRAAQLFAQSELMTKGGMPKAELEAALHDVMSIMEAGYLHDHSDQAKAMRKLLLAGGMLVAAAENGISDAEKEALEDFLGAGTVTERLSIEALREDLPNRMKAVREEAPPSRRAQVIRDLAVIAMADGHAHEGERAVLDEIAVGLGLSTELVGRTLDASHELD